MFEHSTGQKASNKLLKLLLKTALISSVLIIVVVGYAVSLLYSQHVIEDAEYDAISVGEAIVSFEKHQLISVDDQNIEHLRIPPDGFKKLDVTMQKALAPFDIIKIKVFTEDATIIYSTDHSIIGKSDPDNPSLQIALAGGVSSNRKTTEEVTDLLGEKKFDVDVVETYIPIVNSLGNIVGSFEVYQDVSSSNYKSQEGIVKSLTTLTIVLVIVFSLSLIIIRVAVKELNLAQHELHKMATEDALTGLKNRGAIVESVKREVSRNQGLSTIDEGNPVSLIMVDVDHFKSINDSYGHPVGDSALQELARIMEVTIRDNDTIGRYGGEEFLLVFPDTDQEEAKLLAERVRHDIENIDFFYAGKKITLTASLGVTTIGACDTDYEQALKRADEALYRAKYEGRNRVSIG
ncbi:GGDEF domain-containing protein [Neptunomonas sp.]|uniref:GGDEF domain-containing protein n=1 Tax=Neptunomonas sp. TaxID=1971898 RepID=UPI0025D47CD1|nr:GGDEF domain-containing protein [Neptunomonas sp.]